ncbi:MAG: hypothetical protein R3D52_00485 [Xanthobacteraceae bacterium]
MTPLASVAVRTRIDSEIVGIHFTDGAVVSAGDLLVVSIPAHLKRRSARQKRSSHAIRRSLPAPSAT